MKEEDSENR